MVCIMQNFYHLVILNLSIVVTPNLSIVATLSFSIGHSERSEESQNTHLC